MMDLTVATFNLYGLNQGLSMLAELCQTCNIIFVQEHRLLPSDLERLAAVDCRFTSISSSAMENTIGRGVLSGVSSIGQFRSMNRLPFGLNRLPCPQND